MTQRKWYEHSHRRSLIDMHIEQWNPEFLSQYEPARYVELLRQAHVQSAMIYAHSHAGYCYWPTPVGHMHEGIAGQDIVAETVAALRRASMDVILYYSLVYDNWAYDHIPDIRILGTEGRGSRHGDGESMPPTSRYGVCCPNAPAYRDYVRAQLQSLAGYDADGMFLDMTFWPDVCRCRHCAERFARETGRPLPRAMDWSDPDWQLFQRHREEWMTEFARFCTDVIQDANPRITVQHQYSTAPGWWQYGVTDDMAAASDFASGDLYGGYAEQSAVCKLFYSLTANQPFEYMTSRCYPNLRDHTTAKTEEMLRLHNSITLAHNGAFLFIDAIDPRGTMNPETYARLGRVFAESMALEPYLRGELAQDVGVYYSLRAKYDPDERLEPGDGKAPSRRQPHLEAVMGAANCLRRNHIPFGICSGANLAQLSRYQLLVVPDLVALSDEEAAAFREYVRQGGVLYASGRIDLGKLGDLFGVRPAGITAQTYTYIRPEGDAGGLLPGVTADYPLAVEGRQPLAEAAGCEVLGRVTLPYTDPQDHGRFASIHSNPPGRDTQYPALVRRREGGGAAVWCSAAIEAIDKPAHQDCAAAIFRSLLIRPLSIVLEGPPVVEALRFDDPAAHGGTIRLVNLQEQMPVLPVFGLTVRLLLAGRALHSLTKLPSMEPVAFSVEGDYAVFAVDRLDVFDMYRFEF